MSGFFITLEGIEGVGKSTQIDFVADYLKTIQREYIITREPGGTPLGEGIRALVLDKTHTGMSADAELLLMFAARAEHLDKVIKPALNDNKVVLCDRFTDASYAYQGVGRSIPEARIKQIETWVQQGLQPDLTLLLDAPVEIGLQRASQRSEKDRFESEKNPFFEAVRNCYLEIAEQNPQRVHVINAVQNLQQVKSQLQSILKEVIQ